MYIANRFSSAVVSESLTSNPQELPILGKPLQEVQDWAVRLSAGQWSSNEEAQLWIRDDVYVTHQAIYAFLEVAKGQEKVVSWRADGLVGGFVEEIAFEDNTPMMIWSPTMSSWQDVWLQEASVLEIEVTAHTIAMPAPQADMEYDLIQLPITDAVVMPMRHWSQTLWANLLGLAPYLWRELVGASPVQMIFRLGWAYLQGWSKDPRVLMRYLNRVGKNTFVHPSAIIEASIIGDNVIIGANAVVRGSIVRDNARIEDLALVEGSVLSYGAVVQRQAMVKYAVLEAKSSVAGVVQLGVVGENASVKRGGYLMDMNFANGVRVSKNGTLVDAPLGMIGSCICSDTTVGLGVAIAAGRWVPPNLTIVDQPQNVVSKIPDGLSGVVWSENGSLRGANVR